MRLGMKTSKTGITIVELLIATVVFSLMIALIFMMARHSSIAAISLKAQNTFQNICGRLTDRLKQDLGSAKEVVLGQNRIDLQRYASWENKNGLSMEQISYFSNENGILIERNESKIFHDLSSVRKAVDGKLEFIIESEESSKDKLLGGDVIVIEIRIVPQTLSQIPCFVHRTLISTSAQIRKSPVPEKIRDSN